MRAAVAIVALLAAGCQAQAFIASPAGSELTVSSNDSATVNVTLPQAFTFWRQSFTTVGVSTNGFAVFPSLASGSYYTSNNTTPATTAGNFSTSHTHAAQCTPSR